MTEKYVQANGIQLAYDEFGKVGDPAIVLIMGLGTQMIAWPVAFCEDLASRGFRVIRFDNRDVGLSQKFDGMKAPNALKIFAFPMLNLRLRAPYTLHDMAEDALGLCDALGVSAAHWVGASMGGMIAQIIAGEHPDRCLSLTSIMSSSGALNLPRPKPSVALRLVKRPKGTAEQRLAHTVETWKVIGSPGYRPTDDELRARIMLSYERSFYPQGFPRQLAAIVASGDRCKTLAKVKAPSLVIHGKDDVLVPLECGLDTHRRIPLSQMEIIDGMGHDVPAALATHFADLISTNAARAA